MRPRPLGQTGLEVSPVGFGSFKIGRNTAAKYPAPYDCPSLADTERLLNGLLDLGISYFDTAPAYGRAESLIGQCLANRNDEFVVSTKVGEHHHQGQSAYDFSRESVLRSLAASRQALRRDTLDLVFIHAHADDLEIVTQTDVVEALLEAKQQGEIRCCGLSAKTVTAARQALDWADVLMLEYHPDDRRFQPIIAEASAQGRGVVIKKALASGHLPAETAIQFALLQPGVDSVVVGSLNLDHMRQNVAFADA